MQADQAAGLRGKLSKPCTQVVSVFSAQSALVTGLAQMLKRLRRKVLLVDTEARHSLATKTPSIFTWQQQAARNCLQPVSVSGLAMLDAPGALAGDAVIVQAGKDYDCVLFEAPEVRPGALSLDGHTPQTLIVNVGPEADAVYHAYALLKTLRENKLDYPVILCGDALRCERILQATRHFMPASSGTVEVITGEGDALFTALAARISAAEIATSRFHNNTGGKFAQHG